MGQQRTQALQQQQSYLISNHNVTVPLHQRRGYGSNEAAGDNRCDGVSSLRGWAARRHGR